MEIGGPMASMYLSPKIQIITQITNFELSIGQILYELLDMHGILTAKSVEKTQFDTTENKGRIIGRTLIQDYVFRPAEYSQMLCMTGSDYHHVEKCPKKI